MEEVPIYQKVNLTIEETAKLTNIGETRIRELLKERDCDFALQVGRKTLIKREPFIKFLMGKSVL